MLGFNPKKLKKVVYQKRAIRLISLVIFALFCVYLIIGISEVPEEKNQKELEKTYSKNIINNNKKNDKNEDDVEMEKKSKESDEKFNEKFNDKFNEKKEKLNDILNDKKKGNKKEDPKISKKNNNKLESNEEKASKLNSESIKSEEIKSKSEEIKKSKGNSYIITESKINDLKNTKSQKEKIDIDDVEGEKVVSSNIDNEKNKKGNDKEFTTKEKKAEEVVNSNGLSVSESKGVFKNTLPQDNASDKKMIEECLKIWGTNHKDDESDMNKKDGESCPRSIPEHLYDQYTLNKSIGVYEWYKCQTGKAYDKRHEYKQDWIDENIKLVSERRQLYYGQTDTYFYSALDDYPFKDLSVVILGSQRPIYESFCIVFQGKSCTTIDFQPIIAEDPRLETLTIAQYDKNPRLFDAAISISSFEHDGLGRYGDPLRPDGDLEMMKKMKCLVRPGGYLYLSVPIAKDKIVWNMHRVYGNIRLPLLLQHWTLLGVYGTKSDLVSRYSGCDAFGEGDYQPMFVLQNTIPPKGANEKILNKYYDPKLAAEDHKCDRK